MRRFLWAPVPVSVFYLIKKLLKLYIKATIGYVHRLWIVV